VIELCFLAAWRVRGWAGGQWTCAVALEMCVEDDNPNPGKLRYE
jgi:hypothetical protein